MKLSEKFEEALIYATRAHGNQMRKKTGIPYIAHILGVTAIALEYGANETEAIAALLHDTVEDCGGADGCAISGRDLGMTWPGSLMVAPTRMKRQSRRGWNENEVTSSISRSPMLRRDWCQHPINCITRARSWLSFEETVWKCSNGLRVRRTVCFGITGRLSPRFASMGI